MKKLNYFLLGLAGLTLASCANDDLRAPGSGDGVQITVNLPGDLGTRADDTTPLVLSYAVYDNGALVEKETLTETFQGTHTLNLKLLSGKTYTMAFFAEVKGYENVFTFDMVNKTVTVNYDAMNSAEANNAGNYDCFYGSLGEFTADANGLSVTLVRPLAQINWGTNDLSESSVAASFEGGFTATLTTKAYSQFNIMTGAPMGPKAPIRLGAWEAPTGAYPVTANPAYQYVGMEYVLAGPTSELYDLNLAVTNKAGTSTDVVVNSAPLQANYRTNIYGSLLTDNFSVAIDVAPWGGDILDPQDLGDEIDGSGLYYNKTNKTYSITSVSALKKMSEISQSQSLQNYTMVLTTDLDMTGVTDYTPIKNSLGNFDGQGHTIKNFTLAGTTYVGFFSQGLGKIQNVTFEDANVSGNHYVGIVAGYGANAQFNNITIKGGKVTTTPMLNGSTYKYGDKAGAITGYLSGEDGTAKVTNCNVSGVTVTGYTMVGSLVGYANFSPDHASTSICNISNNTASDCTVTANQNFDGTYGEAVGFNAGEICGYYAAGTTESNNTATNVTVLTINGEGAYAVSSIEQIRAISELPASQIYGQTIMLTDNIDLNGATVLPLDFGAMSKDFNDIVIDGGNYTISNFTVKCVNSTESVNNGLFANLHGTLKNLNVDKMTINDNIDGRVGLVGYFVGYMSNVTVSNSTITTNEKGAAALVGIFSGGTIEDCKAINCTISGVNRISAIAGNCNENEPHIFKNCEVSGCTITCNEGQSAGPIIGKLEGGTQQITDCTVVNTTVNGVSTTDPTYSTLN